MVLAYLARMSDAERERAERREKRRKEQTKVPSTRVPKQDPQDNKLQSLARLDAASASTSEVAPAQQDAGFAGSLPPKVEGDQRGALDVRVGPLGWTNSELTKDVVGKMVRVYFRFWGQEQILDECSVRIQPLIAGSVAADLGEGHPIETTLKIPIRCSPKNFARYLKDSEPIRIQLWIDGALWARAQVDIGQLEVQRPLQGTFTLVEVRSFKSVAQLDVGMRVDYSMISSFELNEHIASTDMNLPLFPVPADDDGKEEEERKRTHQAEGETETDAEGKAGAQADASRGDAGGAVRSEGAYEEEDGRPAGPPAEFGWGPAPSFRTAKEEEEGDADRPSLPHSVLVDGPGVASEAAEHATVVEPTWDAVLARAQKLSNAMNAAISDGPGGGALLDAGVPGAPDDAFGEDAPAGSLIAMLTGKAFADAEQYSPMSSISSDGEARRSLGAPTEPWDAGAFRDAVRVAAARPPAASAAPRAESDSGEAEEPAAPEGEAAGGFVLDVRSDTPEKGGPSDAHIEVAVRVKHIQLSKGVARPSQVMVALRSSLCSHEERGAFMFTAQSIRHQGRLYFDVSGAELEGMGQDKIVMSVEFWEASNRGPAMLMDRKHAKLIGLAKFCVRDILHAAGCTMDALVLKLRAQGEEVRFVVKNPVANLIHRTSNGDISLQIEMRPKGGASIPASPANLPAQAEAAGGAGPVGDAALLDHVFDVIVDRATGLDLKPDLLYFLSYTFQSLESAQPLCTRPVAASEVITFNAKACHTLTLPRSETVLMNVETSHNQSLMFDLQGIAQETGGSDGPGEPSMWHATATLNFMDLVEMTCGENPETEQVFHLLLTMNDALYGSTFALKKRPKLIVRVKYHCEAHERSIPKKKVILPKKTDAAPNGDEKGMNGGPEHPERVPEQVLEQVPTHAPALSKSADEEEGMLQRKASVTMSLGQVCGLKTMLNAAMQAGADASLLSMARKVGPNTFVKVAFAPKDTYYEDFLPELITDIEAENWIPDYKYNKSFPLFISPTTVDLMVNERIRIEVWHYTPQSQKPTKRGAGGKILLAVGLVPWSNILTSPRGISGWHVLRCPATNMPVGTIAAALTLRTRSDRRAMQIQHASPVESSSVLRGMLDKDFLEQNERGIEPFMGKYANFVIAVDDVTVESSDFVYFNHKLKYVVSMSVNGFMGETVSKASHPDPASRRLAWRKLNISHKAFKSFKMDRYFMAAVNASPLTVKLFECDQNRPDVEVASGEIDLSQLLLKRNSLGESTRMLSGSYALISLRRDHVEIRVRVKILLKMLTYAKSPHSSPPKALPPQAHQPPAVTVPRAHIRRTLDMETGGADTRLVQNYQSISQEVLDEVLGIGSEEGEDDAGGDPSEGYDGGEGAAGPLSVVDGDGLESETDVAMGDDAAPSSSKDVRLCIEDALHMRIKAKASASMHAYVSFVWPESEEVICSTLARCSQETLDASCYRCKWFFAKHLTFMESLKPVHDTLHKRAVILQVWARDMDAAEAFRSYDFDYPVTPEEQDFHVGSAAVDVTALFSGLEELCGWYNIIDYNQHCCGQLKVKIASLTQSTYRHTAAPLLLEGAATVATSAPHPKGEAGGSLHSEDADDAPPPADFGGMEFSPHSMEGHGLLEASIPRVGSYFEEAFVEEGKGLFDVASDIRKDLDQLDSNILGLGVTPPVLDGAEASPSPTERVEQSLPGSRVKEGEDGDGASAPASPALVRSADADGSDAEDLPTAYQKLDLETQRLARILSAI